MTRLRDETNLKSLGRTSETYQGMVLGWKTISLQKGVWVTRKSARRRSVYS